MKKVIALMIVVALAVAACRKNKDTISVAYTTSYPVVTITSDTFFTIQVGGALPNTVTATAYDTFYKKSLDSFVVIDYSSVNVDAAGLYIITASVKNQTGYIGRAYAYVNVVSNLATMFNFTGRYMQQTNGDTVFVTSKINHRGAIVPGFYTVDNVAGVHAYDSANYIVPAFFAQQSNTMIVVPSQYTSLGQLNAINASCIAASADTAFQYQVVNSDFASYLRVFKRF